MSEHANVPAVHKPSVMAGGQVAALIPQSLDEAFRVSQAIAISGLAPRGIDKAEQIMVAIMAGAELGLAPFQSLQSFAVVNGRPTLWGDGLLAVVRGRGVKVREWLEGDGDATVAHCECTRPDNGEQIAREFSVADARKAGLWAKTGPWTQYPKRMLQMRARALSLRDGCADMLRGIQVREEVEDYQVVRTVHGEPTGLVARLGKGGATEGFTATQAEEAPPAEVIEDADFVANAEEVAEVGAGDFVDAHAEEAAPVEDPEPETEADAFDPMDWAGSFTRGLASLATVTEVSAAWSRAKADGYVAMLRAKSEDAAKQLAEAVNERVAEINKAGA